MKPELSSFFDNMDAFFAGRADEVPGAPADRMALYARFVAAHPRSMLEKNFPLTRNVLGEETWARLSRAYVAAHPPRSFEINQAASDFPSYLAERVDVDGGVPAFVPALARFEWCDFCVFAADVEVPQTVHAPTVTSTLEVLTHGYRLVPWLQSAKPRPEAPEAGEETALLWRHPSTHRVRFRAADASALLALKIALESVPVEDAAQEAGMPQANLKALLRRHADEGLLLLPDGF